MGDLVTVIDFWIETEASIAKGLLASHGIRSYIKDEFMNETSYYSNAIGGIKVQVEDRDEADAISVLKANGYLKDDPAFDAIVPNAIQWIDKKTASIPYFKKISLLPRVGLCVVLLATFLAIILNLFI